MPNDPVYFKVWRFFKTQLAGMRVAEGYHLDYGAVMPGARVHGINDSDFDRPKIGLRWVGEVGRDPFHGGDMATHTQERFARFEVTIPAKQRTGPDDDTERAYRMLDDVHAAIMSGARTADLDNSAIFENEPVWLDRDEFDQPIGGTLLIPYTVRFRHMTGDMSTVR